MNLPKIRRLKAVERKESPGDRGEKAKDNFLQSGCQDSAWIISFLTENRKLKTENRL
jgi:hypothetical protein